MLLLDAALKECIRRASNRKLDPQTGIIYHMEDNPPPEDKAILARLQIIDDPEATEVHSSPVSLL